jgi:hypothetical protein
MTHEEFMKIVRETNAKNKIPIEDLPIKEQLIRRINSNMKTEEEYFQLKKDIQDYLKSDAPEEDKRKVALNSDCIWMTCSAFEEMRKRGEKWGK